jgi:VWFA-related protein
MSSSRPLRTLPSPSSRRHAGVLRAVRAAAAWPGIAALAALAGAPAGPLLASIPAIQAVTALAVRTALPAIAALGVLEGISAAAQQVDTAHIVPSNPPPPSDQPAPAPPAAPPAASAPPAVAPPAATPPPAAAQPQQAQPSSPAPAGSPSPAPAPSSPAAASPASPAAPAPPPSPSAKAAQPPRRQTAPAAAPAPQPIAPLFGEQIEVRVVNVEAVVTDRKGNRVPDLKPEDFRLKVDGKPTKIEYFSEIRGGQTIAPEPGATETIPGLPDLAPGSPVGTSYLVFIDDYFSVEPRRNEVLHSLKDDLTRLGPEDRMAMVAYDGRHLNMLSSWSSSVRDLARAIEQEIGNRSHGLERQAELRSLATMERGGGGRGDLTNSRAFGRDLNIQEQAYVDELGQQLARVIGAATSTLRGFASPPGRKVMLVLSGGWPFSPADYAINNVSRPVMTNDVPSGEQLLRPLVETANRLGYTLYPVDVPGMETDAVNAGRMSPGSASMQLGMREQEHEGTLKYLADETGGRALLNSLRIASLKTVEADTRSYYWLGFTPAWQGNDKRHAVQLEALRPGLTVRTRDSFLDRSRKAENSMLVESAMLFGNVPGAAIMPVELGKPVKSSRREMEVAVTLAIPTDSFVTVPINGKFAAELELRVAAQDERGDRSDIPVVPLQLSSDKEPGKGHYIRYQTKVKLRRANQHLIFAVFDPLSNKVTTAEADVKPD